MAIDICDTGNWITRNGPAKFLPNNYSSNLDFTKYESISLGAADLDPGCLRKNPLDDKLRGVSSITANKLILRGPINVSTVTCTDLGIIGGIAAQGERAPNLNINITSSSGNMELLTGDITPFTNLKVTGVGSVNVPSNTYLSKAQGCLMKHYLDSQEFDKCVKSITPRQEGGTISITNGMVGFGMELNAGYIGLREADNYGNINNMCRLEESSNEGNINGVSIFVNSTNEGNVNGPLAIFEAGGVNNNISNAGKSVFTGGTNAKYVIGESIFTGGSNQGICSGSCYLLGGSNQGLIVGNTMISGGGSNQGTISGSVTIYPGGSTNGTVVGSVNAISGGVGGYISGSVTALGCQISTLNIIGISSFDSCSVGTVNSKGGPVSAKQSTIGSMGVSGDSIQLDRSSLGNGLLNVSSASFKQSSNGADIIRPGGASAIFESGSSNNGRLLDVQASFFNATNEGNGNGIFSFNKSINFGSLSGIINLSNLSTNNGSILVESNISIDNSINGSTIIILDSSGNANFSNQSVNNGEVEGNATFSNKSFNYGTVYGDAIFDNTSANYGLVFGDCEGSGCV